MCQAIINCINIINKPKGLTIISSDNKIYFNYEIVNIAFKYTQKKSQDTIQIEPESFPLAHHILRIIKMRLHINDIFEIDCLFDVLNSITEIISTGPFKYCTVCGSEIMSSNGIGFCTKNKSSCFDDFCYFTTDNYIFENYKRDPLAILFLIKTAIECLNSHKKDQVFNPLPRKYEKDGVKNFNALSQIISKYSEKMFKETLNMSLSELDILNKLGQELYGFIKFIIMTNKTYIRSEKILNDKYIFNDDDSLKIDNEIEFMNFQVIHHPKIEEKFKTIKPQYLFHGSAIGNWYSIMRNGLKNYSGTNMMAHGAAYGSGIYLSDQASFSLGYSMRGTAYNDDKSQIMYVIGVVQIMDEKENYKKAPNIYVVDDDNKILLRYLILTNGKNLNKVQKYVMIDRVNEISLYNKNITAITIKRLRQELKNIDALSKKKYNRHLPLNFPDPKLSQGSLPRNVHLLLSVTTNLKQTACMHADETLIIAIISFN